MKTYVRIALAGAGGALVVVLVVWTLALPAVVGFADKHDGLAAWVQAIFSVVAIVGTWFVGERQAAHARQLRTEEDEARRTEAMNAEGRQREETRSVALAFADLTIERLVACETILIGGASVEDAEGLKHDLSYTRQLLMDFKVSDLAAAKQMLIFTAFAGLVGNALTVIERQIGLAKKHSHGWVVAFSESMLVEVQMSLKLARERRQNLEALFDEARAAEAFHAGGH